MQAPVNLDRGPMRALARHHDAGGVVDLGAAGRKGVQDGLIWLGWMLHMRVKPNSREARSAALFIAAVSLNSVTTQCDGTLPEAWQAEAISSLARITSG